MNALVFPRSAHGLHDGRHVIARLEMMAGPRLLVSHKLVDALLQPVLPDLHIVDPRQFFENLSDKHLFGRLHVQIRGARYQSLISSILHLLHSFALGVPDLLKVFVESDPELSGGSVVESAEHEVVLAHREL